MNTCGRCGTILYQGTTCPACGFQDAIFSDEIEVKEIKKELQEINKKKDLNNVVLQQT